MKLGTSQQCNITRYTSAMFQDWEHLSKVKVNVFIRSVLGLLLPQQFHKSRYASAML